jgi:hypothetical protein
MGVWTTRRGESLLFIALSAVYTLRRFHCIVLLVQTGAEIDLSATALGHDREATRFSAVDHDQRRPVSSRCRSINSSRRSTRAFALCNDDKDALSGATVGRGTGIDDSSMPSAMSFVAYTSFFKRRARCSRTSLDCRMRTNGLKGSSSLLSFYFLSLPTAGPASADGK